MLSRLSALIGRHQLVSLVRPGVRDCLAGRDPVRTGCFPGTDVPVRACVSRIPGVARRSAGYGLKAERRMRWIARVALGLVALLLGLAALGAAYEAVASAQDGCGTRRPAAWSTWRLPPAPAVPGRGQPDGAPGRLVRRLVGRVGAVQPASRAPRGCAPGTAPAPGGATSARTTTPRGRTPTRCACSRQAGIDGPYVLVAAPYAGRVARLYTSEHPEQVVGLVFVDASHETPYGREGPATRSALVAAGNWVLSRLGVGPAPGARLVPFIDGPVGDNVPKPRSWSRSCLCGRRTWRATLASPRQPSPMMAPARGRHARQPAAGRAHLDRVCRPLSWRGPRASAIWPRCPRIAPPSWPREPPDRLGAPRVRDRGGRPDRPGKPMMGQ